jgi:hypothetical protein
MRKMFLWYTTNHINRIYSKVLKAPLTLHEIDGQYFCNWLACLIFLLQTATIIHL